VGLYRQWGSNIDEGWTRWLLEQYHYAPTSVYNKDMQAGGLKAKYDVLILPDMGGRGTTAGKSLLDGIAAADAPARMPAASARRAPKRSSVSSPMAAR
jgi:hypothetical protein